MPLLLVPWNPPVFPVDFLESRNSSWMGTIIMKYVYITRRWSINWIIQKPTGHFCKFWNRPLSIWRSKKIEKRVGRKAGLLPPHPHLIYTHIDSTNTEFITQIFYKVSALNGNWKRLSFKETTEFPFWGVYICVDLHQEVPFISLKMYCYLQNCLTPFVKPGFRHWVL